MHTKYPVARVPSDTHLDDCGQCWPWIGVVVMLCACTVVALPFDIFVARWLLAGNLPEAMGDLLHRSEAFAHGIGIAIILTAVYLLDVNRRWALPRLLVTVLGAAAIANGAKLLVSRVRPYKFDFQGGVLDTFQGWLPLLDVGSSHRSLPSAHTMSAIALAVGLMWLYPRGRWLFLTVATLAALQRLQTGSHYLSDVFAGAALGWFWAVGVVQHRFKLGWLDRWEANRRFGESRAKSTQLPPSTSDDIERAA